MESINLDQGMPIIALATLPWLLLGVLCTWLFSRHTSRSEDPSRLVYATDPIPAAQRSVQLKPLELNRDEADTDIDIIAIHGLDTTSRDTWTWKDCRDPKNKEKWVSWLDDPEMLPSIAQQARIFTCDWPADVLEPSDLVRKTIDEYALLLLDGIQRALFGDGKRREDRPLVFIASCLGGIILAKALVRADDKSSGYYRLRRATRGIVFLATPFRGTAFQDVTAWAVPGLKVKASLQGQELCQDKDSPCEVFNFYELGTTSLPHKAFPWLPTWFDQRKQLVDMSSATLDIIPDPLPLNRRHTLMNKFHGAGCADYEKVAGKIREIVAKIHVRTPLEQADALIRNDHYNEDRLRIERLSGEQLPMHQCYINLAIVEQPGHKADRSDTSQLPTFSLFARQKVETPDKTVQIELAKIFDARKGRDGCAVQPRRILIRGRAGVGKTTLCKKMVYDFMHDTKLHRSWAELFDRLLWVPLRRLKGRSGKSYNLGNLFHDEFFSQCNDAESHRLVGAMWDATQSQNGGRTLFILDGMDEISGEWNRDDAMHTFLETLLNQPNVIITSRPSGTLLTGLHPVDLELETIGFYPDQVEAYLYADPKIKHRAKEIQSFLQGHWLIQGLVRIPIQLDALCYTWDDFDPGTVPDTMTGIYEAIAQRLWRKDAVRMGKRHNGQPVTHSHVGISNVEDFVEHEIRLLEGLAFTGLDNDVIEFTPKHRAAISRQFKHPSVLFDKTLPGLSFLRTSDSLPNNCNQNYHFLHLTFQEYFAARHFVRHWSLEQPLACLDLRGKVTKHITPVEFLHKQKYSARYDVFWRFVAGFLAAEDEDKGGPGANRGAFSFFHAIEQDPLDLLGPTHQRLVMHCLSEVSTEILSDETLAAVVQRLNDDNGEAKWAAVDVLAKQPSLSDETLAAVVQRLNDDDEYVRWAAAEVLRKRSSLSDESVAAVVQRLNDDNGEAKWAAVDVLAKQPSLSDETLAVVVQRLNDEDEDVRRAAVGILGKQPSLCDEILAAVMQRLNDDDEDVRRVAVEALRERPSLSDETLAALVQWLDDDNGNAQWAAVEILGKQPSLSDQRLAALVQRLDDDRGSVRMTALEVLGKQPSLSNESVAAVVQRLNDDDNGGVRMTAIKILGQQPSLSDETLAVVVQRLKDGEWFVRMAVVEVLGKQPSLSDECLAAVVQRLNDDDEDVRRAAVEVLRERQSLSDGPFTHSSRCCEDSYPAAYQSVNVVYSSV
ncbi:Protein zds1 [Purpureocillium lavendulum]|uniref:Protein zds1 n=1 Tax=Purpureocillium lavendulum TaxID=1247861 RepID=A0AB34FIV6_9HYPO|nr:Protein zds1 [Purpureocillium lavendulum]